MDEPSMALASARKRARFSEVSANLRAASASGNEGEMLFVHALPFRHHRRENQGERGIESHECLEEQEGLVGVVAMEGALTVEGAPEGHGGKHEGCSGRPPAGRT
jgi:hypothetical protein